MLELIRIRIVIGLLCMMGFVSVYAKDGKQKDIVRYTAGQSIPIGNGSGYDKNNNNEVEQIRTIRYTAGQSIPIGNGSGYDKNNNNEVEQIRTIRYTAGQSIPIIFKDSSDKNLNKSKIIQKYSEDRNKIIPESSYLPLAGALGDSISTYIGVNSLGLKEANGLISTNPAGLVGLFVIKAGMTYYFENQPSSIRKAGLKATTGVWTGVTMNNLLLIAGASNPVSIVGGVLFGTYMYKKEGEILDRELNMVK